MRGKDRLTVTVGLPEGGTTADVARYVDALSYVAGSGEAKQTGMP